MNSNAVKGRRKKTLISSLVAQNTLIYGSQTTARQLGVVIPHRYQLSFAKITFNPTNIICFQDRLQLITEGHLCVPLIQRLLCFNGKYAVKYPFKMGQCILSRHHFLEYTSVTYVATLKGHSSWVTSVAFHPTASLLATGSRDKTAKVWQLSSDNSSATCVATLKGHSCWVTSVAFHPTASLLATGSRDKTAKLWLLSSDNLSATCVATLEGHNNIVWSVAFHPTNHLLATSSTDNSAKLWRMSSDNSSATCVATLDRHDSSVISNFFHPNIPLLTTSSSNKTAKLTRCHSENSHATCVATLTNKYSSLAEYRYEVYCIAFHSTASLMATGGYKNVKLWRLSSDKSSATCVATLARNSDVVRGIAFHPTTHLFATTNLDTVNLWRL